jgi:hypothetical protein
MLAALELNEFAKTPTSLRVTLPVQGAQNTYYLAIKPHYSVLLIVSLMFLHLLTARAFNVVAVDTYDVLGHYSHRRITYAISTPSAVLALALGFVMLCVLAYALERKFDAGMPVVGSCSMAVSAKCYVSDDVVGLGQVKFGRDARSGKLGFLSHEG